MQNVPVRRQGDEGPTGPGQSSHPGLGGTAVDEDAARSDDVPGRVPIAHKELDAVPGPGLLRDVGGVRENAGSELELMSIGALGHLGRQVLEPGNRLALDGQAVPASMDHVVIG